MPVLRACSKFGCPEYAESGSTCPTHRRARGPRNLEAEKRREQKRTAEGRGRGVGRRERYGKGWSAHSKQRRAEEGQCQRCGSDADLTVDHESDWVLCRPCHARLEAWRRAQAKAARRFDV